MYNSGWANLKPQESKYTPALALQAAKLLEAGTSLSATARELHVSRATLRNWRRLNPTLNQAFAVFEANKAKTAAHRLHVRKYKQVAEAIEEAEREIAAISYAWSSDILRQREVGWFINSVFLVAIRMIYEMRRFILKIPETRWFSDSISTFEYFTKFTFGIFHL